MENIPSSTNMAIKRKLSVSDVADALGISRPTLYRMMEDYENGDYSNLSGEAIRLFDVVTRDDVGPEEAQAYLLDMRRRNRSGERSSRPKEAGSPDLDRSVESVRQTAARLNGMAAASRGPSWTEGKVRTCSFGQNGRSMVLFDGPEGSYKLELWIRIGGEMFMLSEYRAEEGKRFFTVSDVIPRPDYVYEVLCTTGHGIARSGKQELRFR